MDVTDITSRETIRLLLDKSGKSAYRLSLDLGKSRNYVINAVGKDPKLSTVAAVASATGHEVAILDAGTGEVVAIVEPPEREAPED